MQLSQTEPKEYHLSEKDKKIVLGIKNYDSHVLSKFYNEYYESIKKMVIQFRNPALDPEDIFQEGLIRAVMNIRENKFKENSSFLTYLNRICYYICLKKLGKNPDDYPLNDGIISIPDEENRKFELYERVLSAMKQLDEKCRDLINLRFYVDEITNPEEKKKLRSYDAMANKLNINPASVGQFLQRCLKKFKEIVKNDSEIQEYLEA